MFFIFNRSHCLTCEYDHALNLADKDPGVDNYNGTYISDSKTIYI